MTIAILHTEPVTEFEHSASLASPPDPVAAPGWAYALGAHVHIGLMGGSGYVVSRVERMTGERLYEVGSKAGAAYVPGRFFTADQLRPAALGPDHRPQGPTPEPNWPLAEAQAACLRYLRFHDTATEKIKAIAAYVAPARAMAEQVLDATDEVPEMDAVDRLLQHAMEALDDLQAAHQATDGSAA